MKVGIIAPIKFLERYCIADIQYCLPRFLVEEASYRDFYLKRWSAGDFLILDCRMPTWRRQPEDFNIVRKALKIVDPAVVIAPSYMFNAEATVRIHKEFVEEFKCNRVVGCLEGASGEEVMRCLEETSITFSALPAHMYRHTPKGTWGPQTIFIDNHLNLGELDGQDGILVTSLPIKLGFQGRLLSDYLPSPPSLTFHEEEDRYPQITMKNVEETIEYYKACN